MSTHISVHKGHSWAEFCVNCVKVKDTKSSMSALPAASAWFASSLAHSLHPQFAQRVTGEAEGLCPQRTALTWLAPGSWRCQKPTGAANTGGKGTYAPGLAYPRSAPDHACSAEA